ncbi:efflux RND transporter permease subunit [Thermaerobacillus caldiproteolyticus]|uniref:HAE1 family hydrophobic/amphiphilic exporter-1 n=1 Tax=Thermaerobacillus caldiproteolyticus TaxID=247480 RepID=A0A7W0BZ03_9BACL|nr:efflux RND transporter permease subunit [Anoxybacillus caldiproteolyticus]MBA2873609.1 HAE1 family hydrophobic/amphiphilic exporter-1 [Anoxybacillus caldiproteolyticus]QPA30190.1 efflux RND transporter permease subunit [Anoxybacillus caldiproteolyticus]
MNFLTRFSLKNAVAVFIISFLLILGGLYSFSSLKVDLLPNIEFPQLSIEVTYPGASPEDINNQVTSKLEEKFKSLEGLKQMQSSSFESIAIINLEFPFHTDMDEVERQVDTLIKDTKLPDNVQTKVNRFSFGTFPIFNISLFAKKDVDLQKLLEQDVIPELNKIDGINSVSVGGMKEDVVQITVDKQKALQAGLSLSQIKDQINEKYVSFPAGNVNTDTLQIPVRIQEKLETVRALENMTLTSPLAQTTTQSFQSGAIQSGTPSHPPLKLKDIAKIETVTDRPEITRYNLNESLSMAITKKQDANTVEVADKVIKVLDAHKDEFDYAIGFDSAEGIKQSVESLVREGLLGALFASIAVLVFLRNVRATVIAIVSIPLSLLVASIFLHRMDISLNVMTLGGMAVAVGRVVDDSIVVIENIFRRVRKSKTGITDELVQDSTKEILKAITSSTITTVVVFLPLGFVGGITGEFFLPFALTIVFALLMSLIVAVTVVPILAKFSFKKVPPEEKEGALQRVYGRIIAWSLNHKAIILALSIVLLGGSLALVPKLGFTFLPNEEQKTLVASIELPSSTSLEKTNDVSLKIEKMFDQQKEIKEVTAGIGSRDFRTGLKRPNQASYFINLKEGVNVASFIKKLEKNMQHIADKEAPGTKLGVQELDAGGPPSNNNINIDLYSNDLAALQKAAKQVEDYLNKRKDLKYVTNNFSDKQKQVIVNIDPEKAAAYGVSGFQILGTIADETKPVEVGTLTLDGVDRTVQLSYDKSLDSVDALKNTLIFTKQGLVPISELATVKEVETYTSIQKLDGKVFARISAQIVGDDIQKVTNDIISRVKKDIDLPKGVSFEVGGGSDETVQTFQELGLAMIVAIGLVYITMLITFGKARIPFIILSSLIFVPIGSLLGLYMANEPMSISVMIGLLMLIGIVTTNAIVLVDRIGQNREQKGMTIREALVEAGKTRLRPILMTAFATVTALIPLALTKASGTLISKGLAITVIGGLTSSTLLTLIIIPVMYELFFLRQAKAERTINSN